MTTSGKFLFIEHHPIYGGPHSRAVLLAAPLARHGWTGMAVLPNEPGTVVSRMEAAGIPVISLPLHRLRRSLRWLPTFLFGFFLDVLRLWKLIRRERAELVVVIGLESPQGVVAGYLAKVPVVWQINGTQTPIAYRRIMLRLARWCADVVMSTGETIAREHPGLAELGPRWVPFLSPVDVERFSSSPVKRDLARRELGVKDSQALIVGAIGNINPQKGYAGLIEAAALVRVTHPQTRFIVLGTTDPNHADYQARLWDMAEGLGLELGVDLVVRDAGTRVDEIASALDILWCTSVPRSEGVSNAVIEGMSLGLPIVATDVGGIRDVVTNEENGLLVRHCDPSALAAATRRLLNDGEERLRMGRASRSFILENCRVEHCLASYLHAFAIAIERNQLRIRSRSRFNLTFRL